MTSSRSKRWAIRLPSSILTNPVADAASVSGLAGLIGVSGGFKRTRCFDEDVVEVVPLVHECLYGLHELALDRTAQAAVGQLHPLAQVGLGTLEGRQE